MKLYIFDLDGTICDRDSSELYPHVVAWLESQRGSGNHYAIATNQGGVGWRYWIETDPPAWAVERGITADGLPTLAEVSERVNTVAAQIIATGATEYCPMWFCCAYADRRGNRGPVPRNYTDTTPEWVWMHEFRKPAPGMLQAAMMHAGVAPADTIMVGDRDEDMQAALAAGCGFVWASEFFGVEDDD